MRILKFGFLTALLLLCLAPAAVNVSAQDENEDCPALVAAALEAVDAACTDTGRNEACYGNFMIEATPSPEATDFVFGGTGDTVPVADIDSLTLSGMNTATSEWGVALLSIQANIPDTVPGQNVTMLIFGDVEISDATGDLSGEFGPMQAFYFRSGIGDAGCAEAPSSGLLVQTPEGVAEIALNVNGVDITLGSTAFLQTDFPEGDMADDAESDEPLEGEFMVNLLEGGGTVSVDGVSQTLEPGMVVSVPVNEDLEPVGTPSEPEPFDLSTFGTLPIDTLPEPFELAGSGDESALGSGLEIQSGTWLMTFNELSGCGMEGMAGMIPPTEVDIQGEDIQAVFDAAAGGAGGIGAPGSFSFEGITYEVSSPEPNVFNLTYTIEGMTFNMTMTYVSPTQVDYVMSFLEPGMGCELTMSVTMTAAE